MGRLSEWSSACLNLKMTVLRLPLCLALLVLLLHLLPPPANACFTCNTSGRKKREAATGLLVSQSAVEQEEDLAFAACNTDEAEGLTWQEVEQCGEKYLLLLTEVGIEAPTKADFEAADLDGNGALLFKEWEEWAAEQI